MTTKLSNLSRCLLLLALTLSSAHGGDAIRVLCYNIHWCKGMDGKYDVARVAEVIKAMKPDLVALQEVDVGVKRSDRMHEAQMLGKMTGMAVRMGPTQHYEGGLFGNAVLTKLPILDVAIHPLPYTESTPQRTTYPRGAIAVTVKGPNNKPLRFISTHFQHNVPEDRLEEAKAINNLFAKKGENTPTILAGDMNARPDEPPIKELLKRWIHAAKDPSTPTAPSVKPRSRIDYIFHRPKNRFKVLEERVIAEEMASDHRPVFAVLELAEK